MIQSEEEEQGLTRRGLSHLGGVALNHVPQGLALLPQIGSFFGTRATAKDAEPFFVVSGRKESKKIPFAAVDNAQQFELHAARCVQGQ